MEIPKFQDVKEEVTFSLRVQPRSSKNEIVVSPSGGLKLKLTSPPVKGAANQLCIKLLSQWLELSKSKIQIVSGLKNQNKRIKIIGLKKSNFDLFVNKCKIKP